MKYVREAKVSNRFYSADKTELLRSIETCLNAPWSGSGLNTAPVRGIMLPHAGYIFSGAVAGATLQYAFGAVLDESLDDSEGSAWRMPDTFVILSPNHTGRGAPVAVWPDGAWKTPLGEVEVDAELAEILMNDPDKLFVEDLVAHQDDHSIEVILPFLQVLQPEAKIIPICIADYNYAHLVDIGVALANLFKVAQEDNKEICIIASSDMSHYLPEAEGGKLDSIALENLLRMDSRGLFGTVLERNISMCGVAGVTAMIAAFQRLGNVGCTIAARSNSGIASRHMGRTADTVVGYAGAVFTDSKKEKRVF